MSPTLSDSSAIVDFSVRSSKDLLEDLEMSILTERIRLLASQRQLAALHCERFTQMLESSLTSPSSTAPAQGPQDDVASAEALTDVHISRRPQQTRHHRRRRPSSKAFLARRTTSVPSGFSVDQFYYG